MTDANTSEVLARVSRAKRDDEAPPIPGTKILLFAVQLTLLGGLVDGLEPLAYAAVVLGVLGLLASG